MTASFAQRAHGRVRKPVPTFRGHAPANKKPAGEKSRPGSRVPGLLATYLTWLQAGRLKGPRIKLFVAKRAASRQGGHRVRSPAWRATPQTIREFCPTA